MRGSLNRLLLHAEQPAGALRRAASRSSRVSLAACAV